MLNMSRYQTIDISDYTCIVYTNSDIQRNRARRLQHIYPSNNHARTVSNCEAAYNRARLPLAFSSSFKSVRTINGKRCTLFFFDCINVIPVGIIAAKAAAYFVTRRPAGRRSAYTIREGVKLCYLSIVARCRVYIYRNITARTGGSAAERKN